MAPTRSRVRRLGPEDHLLPSLPERSRVCSDSGSRVRTHLGRCAPSLEWGINPLSCGLWMAVMSVESDQTLRRIMTAFC